MAENQGEAGRGRSFTAAQVQRVVETVVNPFVAMDREGIALWASDSVEELLGVSADDLVGRPVVELVAPGSLDLAIRALSHAAADARTSGVAPTEWEGSGPVLDLLRPDGSTVTCSVSVATPVRTGMGCFVLQLRRADPSRSLEDALYAMGTDRPLPELLTKVTEVLRADLPDAEVVVLRPTEDDALELTPAPDWLAQDIVSPDAFGDLWDEALAHPGEIVERSVGDLSEPLRAAAGDAGVQWVCLHAVDPVVPGDVLTGAVVSVWSRSPHRMHFLNHDRLERCSRLMSVALRWEYGRRALQWAATHDGLTGLHNRASFLAELRAIGEVRRRSTDKTALLYLDLDDFKPVNDRHGHTLGDQVLVEVASRLRDAVRPSDTVARLGGDEFAVLCPGLAGLATAEELAERLVAEVARPMRVEGVEVQIGLSVGIAGLGDDEDGERTLSRADDALRAAKLDGKSRWQRA